MGNSIDHGSQRSTIREMLLWCAPALAVGFFLRALLTWALPYGYIQFDSIDFLETPYYLIAKHQWVVQSKRSFLVPLTYTFPFLLHLPALIFIPLGQHFLGLVQIVMTGAIVRFWFAKWRWFLIPVTLMIAISPWLLWYEHALMGEAEYVFLLIAVAFTGTLWARDPRPKRFALFWLALFLCASSRGEGKLFLLFGVLVVPLVLWRERRRMLVHFAISAVLALVLFKAIRSPSNASTNLYASLLHYAPDHFKSDPDIEPYLAPIRDKVKAQNLAYPADSVQVAKRIQDGIDDYMAKKMPDASTKNRRRAGAKILNRLSVQILRDHPLEVFGLPLVKWRLAVDSWMSGDFDDHFLHEKQKYSFKRDPWVGADLGKGLVGRNMSAAEVDRFIDEHYDAHRTRWFSKLAHAWNKALIAVRTPDHPMPQPPNIEKEREPRKRWVHDYIGGVKGGRTMIPGVPFFYIIALGGMLLAIFRRSPLREAQLAWAITLLIAWYAVLMVGDTIARYSFAYQPFCVVFFFAFFDFVAARIGKQPAAN